MCRNQGTTLSSRPVLPQCPGWAGQLSGSAPHSWVTGPRRSVQALSRSCPHVSKVTELSWDEAVLHHTALFRIKREENWLGTRYGKAKRGAGEETSHGMETGLSLIDRRFLPQMLYPGSLFLPRTPHSPQAAGSLKPQRLGVALKCSSAPAPWPSGLPQL